jgi:hypothetical protein
VVEQTPGRDDDAQRIKGPQDPGLNETIRRRGTCEARQRHATVRYEVAVEIALALGMYPVDAGV